MLHWLWLIPALTFGAAVGFFMASLCVAARQPADAMLTYDEGFAAGYDQRGHDGG